MSKFLRFIFVFILSGITLCVNAQEQQRIIKGKVIDARTKETLIGVSVYVDNKTIGTPTGEANVIANVSIGAITDVNGQFTLKLPADANIKKLQVSYIGYETKTIDLDGSASYTIQLKEDLKQLGEVVVTGYQTISKKKMTGAIDKIDVAKIQQAGVMSVEQMIAGQLAGVAVSTTSGAPGSTPKIRIRGTSSLTGTQDPLWVIDGIPVEGTDVPKTDGLDLNTFSSSIAGINSADIESITVLKDAAATAIYGARAANGVIVVTTKSGKKNEKLTINYRNNFTFTPRPDLSRLNLMNSDQKVDLELGLFGTTYNFKPEMGSVSRIFAKYGVTPTDYNTLGFNGINANARNEINALRGQNTDWNKLLYQNAFTQEHSVSIAGGSDRATYYFSGGYFDEQGTTRGTGATRYNLTLKSDFDLTSKLKFSAGVFVNQRKQQAYITDGASDPTAYSRRANPYTPALDAQGNYVYDPNIIVDDTRLNFNILEERANTSNQNKTNAINANFKLNYNVIPGLNISSQLGIQNESAISQRIALKDSYYTRKTRELSLYTDPATNKTGYVLPLGGVINDGNTQLDQYTLKTMAEYEFTLNKRHDLNFMVGNELRRVKTKGLLTTGYGYNPQTLTTQTVIYPNQTLAQQFDKRNNTFVENAYASFFATGSYTYNRKYTLGGSVRFDGSDLFGADPKYKYLPLWSVSGLWRIAEEDFFKNIKAINVVNLRASYGLQGNIDRTASPFVKGFYVNENILPGGPTNAIKVSLPPNAKLRWEKTTNYNVGLDLEFFNSAIRTSVDFYSRVGTDLINIRMLPLETGFASTSVNWAEMTNKGIELSISTRNIATKNFKWTTDLNVSYNKNTVNKETLPAGQLTPSREGYPVGALFAFPYAGIDKTTGSVLLYKDGKAVSVAEFFALEDAFGTGELALSNLTTEQRRALMVYQGATDPKYSGGLNNTFNYKRFDLSIGLVFNLGHKALIQPEYSIYDYNRGLNTNNAILDRWTPQNINGNYPALIGNSDDVPADERLVGRWWAQSNGTFNQLSKFVKDAGYLRVRNITLGYSLPTAISKKIGLANVRFSSEIRNPFVLYGNYNGFLDPETMGNPLAQPIPKTVSLGVNVTF